MPTGCRFAFRASYRCTTRIMWYCHAVEKVPLSFAISYRTLSKRLTVSTTRRT